MYKRYVSNSVTLPSLRTIFKSSDTQPRHCQFDKGIWIWIQSINALILYIEMQFVSFRDVNPYGGRAGLSRKSHLVESGEAPVHRESKVRMEQ